MKNSTKFLTIFQISILQLLTLYLILHTATSLEDVKRIVVREPNERSVWLVGSSSYPISWTQETTSFRWDIELLNSDTTEKILDISRSLSEYKEKVMSFSWLIPDSVSDGTYVIRVKDCSNTKNYGDSQPFTIQTQELDGLAYNSYDSFSPSSHSASLFTSLNSTQRELLPHEKKHRRHLQDEEQRFKSIKMEDYWPQPREHCTIKRVYRPSREQFIDEFVEPQIPVIITGVMDDWEAMKSWNFEELGQHLIKGVKVDIMDNLTPYSRWDDVRKNMADSLRNPPKIEMNNFHRVYPEMMEDVDIPELFRVEDDFLEIVDSDIRPSRLSLHMEPKRSGYHWRVETINGSMWSALIHGYKRWGLYSPNTFFPPGVVHNKYRLQDSQSSDPFTWWAYTQPYLQDDRKPLECVQRPGEILYIPSGWWWSYVNLNDSIGFKRWMCDKISLRSCLTELKEQADSGRHNYYADIFMQLRHHLSKHYPDFLTADDRAFQSPVSGLGKTFADLRDETSQRQYQEYFGKHEIGKEYLHDGEQDEDRVGEDSRATSQGEKQTEFEENEEWMKQVKEAKMKRNLH